MLQMVSSRFIIELLLLLTLFGTSDSLINQKSNFVNRKKLTKFTNEKLFVKPSLVTLSSSSSSSDSISTVELLSGPNAEPDSNFNSTFYFGIDKQIANIAVPAFVSLFADPLASMVDALYIGRLDPVNQAGMGISISAHYAISKLYNDPLLKTSTSLVAGKDGEDLSASVSTALAIAGVIGILQTIIFVFFGGQILGLMRVPLGSDMRGPALEYLKWRALGVPAATVLLVAIGKSKCLNYCKTLYSIISKKWFYNILS